MATNLTISPQKAQEIMRRADGAMAKLQKIKGKTEEKVGEVFKMIETVGGAVGVGYARAKWGEVTVGPDIPLEALAGTALSLTAFLDLPGKYSEHLHNLGNGILAGWGTIEMVKMGGGVVLSQEEYQKLVSTKDATIAGEVEVEHEAPKRRRAPASLPNGNGRQQHSIRDMFEDEVKKHEVNVT